MLLKLYVAAFLVFAHFVVAVSMLTRDTLWSTILAVFVVSACVYSVMETWRRL